MNLELSEQQLQLLDVSLELPVTILDPRTQRVYCLVPQDEYQALQRGTKGDEFDPFDFMATWKFSLVMLVSLLGLFLACIGVNSDLYWIGMLLALPLYLVVFGLPTLVIASCIFHAFAEWIRHRRTEK